MRSELFSGLYLHAVITASTLRNEICTVQKTLSIKSDYSNSKTGYRGVSEFTHLPGNTMFSHIIEGHNFGTTDN